MMSTDAAAGFGRAILPWQERTSLRIFVGYDERESLAYEVAKSSAAKFGCEVTPIHLSRLRASGMFTRPTEVRDGVVWDLISNRPQSTEFALSRFWVPLLAHCGWCLFTDCDVVFTSSPLSLLDFADPSKAVHVVKHDLPDSGEVGSKMDGQLQVPYARKNWSSVSLWNCNHPANRRLNLAMLNTWHRDDLHGFRWLHDEEIGDLPPEANWLVNVEPKPTHPIVAHFTQGGPWLPGWKGAAYDEIWTRASQR